jgi:hypothetical protein
MNRMNEFDQVHSKVQLTRGFIKNRINEINISITNMRFDNEKVPGITFSNLDLNLYILDLIENNREITVRK